MTELSQQAAVDALDSTTILLDFKGIAAGDYIVLYSSAPKIIASGAIVAKLPCDDNSDPRDWVLIGGVGTDLSDQVGSYTGHSGRYVRIYN